MSKNRTACISSTWTAADATVLATGGYFYGLVAYGSADISTITILDSATIKFACSVATTANHSVVLTTPIIFNNSIVIDITGTASYMVMYSKVLV